MFFPKWKLLLNLMPWRCWAQKSHLIPLALMVLAEHWVILRCLIDLLEVLLNDIIPVAVFCHDFVSSLQIMVSRTGRWHWCSCHHRVSKHVLSNGVAEILIGPVDQYTPSMVLRVTQSQVEHSSRLFLFWSTHLKVPTLVTWRYRQMLGVCERE